MRTTFYAKIILGLSLLLALSAVQAAKPLWSFSPKTPVKVNIRAGEATEVKYVIQNNSSRPKNLKMLSIAGIVQTNPCKLPSHGTCTLILRINGSALQHSIQNGPTLCESGNPNQCYQPSPKDRLDIRINLSPPPPLIAAGLYVSHTIETPLLVQSNNGGTTWSYRINASTPTLPEGLLNGRFRSSDCSGMNCIAAGLYYDGMGNFPLLAQSIDGGLTWNYRITSIHPVLPPGLLNGDLFSASCNNLNCIVAGNYDTGATTFPLLAQSSDGGASWRYRINATSPELPADFDQGSFNGSRCYKSQCIAVGIYYTSVGMYPLLAQSNDKGITWSYRVNADTPTRPANVVGGSLSDVSCVGMNCVATGTYSDGAEFFPLIMQSSNGGINWVYRPTPPLPPPNIYKGFLTSVSCVGQNCVAAGGSSPDNANYVPLLAYSKNGGMNWTYRITATMPTPPAGLIYGSFYSVSCSGLNCIAAGNYFSDSIYPLLAHSSDGGMNWAYRINATIPALPGMLIGFFTSTSCNGLDCIAAGQYTDATLTTYPLLAQSKDGGETWAYKVTASYPALPQGYTLGWFDTANAGSASYLPVSLSKLLKYKHEPFGPEEDA